MGSMCVRIRSVAASARASSILPWLENGDGISTPVTSEHAFASNSTAKAWWADAGTAAIDRETEARLAFAMAQERGLEVSEESLARKLRDSLDLAFGIAALQDVSSAFGVAELPHRPVLRVAELDGVLRADQVGAPGEDGGERLVVLQVFCILLDALGIGGADLFF